MKDAEAGIVVVKDVIDVVGGLFSHRHLFSRAGGKFNDLVRRCEDAQQGRNDCLNSVTNFRHDNLRTAFFLIPKQIATIVLGSQSTGRRDKAVNVINRIING